jgi:uncharacterized protein (UPF0332 family)
VSKEAFFLKATKNAEASATLAKAGHYDGACNRAFYAMHQSARSVLLAIGEEKASRSKTHSGLLSAFNLHIVKTGLIDSKWSTVFAQEERRRLLSDYEGEEASAEDALSASANAREFVAAIEDLLARVA